MAVNPWRAFCVAKLQLLKAFSESTPRVRVEDDVYTIHVRCGEFLNSIIEGNTFEAMMLATILQNSINEERQKEAGDALLEMSAKLGCFTSAVRNGTLKTIMQDNEVAIEGERGDLGSVHHRDCEVTLHRMWLINGILLMTGALTAFVAGMHLVVTGPTPWARLIGAILFAYGPVSGFLIAARIDKVEAKRKSNPKAG